MAQENYVYDAKIDSKKMQEEEFIGNKLRILAIIKGQPSKALTMC
jgi:hypothetical protein